MFIIYGGFVPVLVMALAMTFWPVTLAIAVFLSAPRVTIAAIAFFIAAYVLQVWFPNLWPARESHVGWILTVDSNGHVIDEHPPAH